MMSKEERNFLRKLEDLNEKIKDKKLSIKEILEEKLKQAEENLGQDLESKSKSQVGEYHPDESQGLFD